MGSGVNIPGSVQEETGFGTQSYGLFNKLIRSLDLMTLEVVVNINDSVISF